MWCEYGGLGREGGGGGTYDAVPVQLADGALAQVLLGGGDVAAGGQVGDDLLARPAAVAEFDVRVGEAPLEVRHDAVVGGRAAEVRRVVQVDLLVGAAEDGRALAVGGDGLALREAGFSAALPLGDGAGGERGQRRAGEEELEELHGEVAVQNRVMVPIESYVQLK